MSQVTQTIAQRLERRSERLPLLKPLSLLADVREQIPGALQFLALAGHEQPTSHTTQADFRRREPRCDSVLLPVVRRPRNYIESSVSDDADGRDTNPRCGKICRRTCQSVAREPVLLACVDTGVAHILTLEENGGRRPRHRDLAGNDPPTALQPRGPRFAVGSGWTHREDQDDDPPR